MSNSKHSIVSQRMPLQQCKSSPIKTMNGASSPNSPSSSTTSSKRPLLDDSPSRENAPIGVSHKRQRTRSGTELIDGNMENLNKNESLPLCERNAPNAFVLPCAESSIENINISKQLNNKTENAKCDASERTKLDNVECVNGNTGVLSPHCAATIKYVTQLPEGCAANSVITVEQAASAIESDDDLEDDDNYLDSEPEDNIDRYLGYTNDDEETCCEDDQSIISTITVGSTSSLRSIASETVGSVYMNENGVAANEDGSLLYGAAAALTPLPALTHSLFSKVPVTVNFCKYNEKTRDLPADISRLLKWRFSTITPLIVRKTLSNSGFKLLKKSIQWIGTWGKNPNVTSYKGIKDFQKINHFPGTFQIGRKDKLWKNFARLQSKFGKEEFGFMPKTFVLPTDLASLKIAFDKEGVKKKWIVKPPASARGTGIEVVNKWSQLPVNTPVVVQRYISRPYLINNTKFDIRLYVLVTSFHPLRIFLYEDGLVRFASVEYQKASKTLGDRFMHLTNYSVNKTSSSYTHNDEAGQCQGHKWTLKTLWAYLKTQDVDTGALWSKIADLVIKTMICGESEIISRIRKGARSRYSCFEVFGFDVILDEKIRPWLLEVNISPSIHSASSLDHSVKGPLVSDLLNLVGFHIPDKLTKEQQTELVKEIDSSKKIEHLCLDRRLYTKLLTATEVAKHAQMNAMPRSQYLNSMLDNLEPDDVRQLIAAEDQLNRAGHFTCIFPTADTYQYFPFIDRPRYYNRLLDAWESTYSSCREKGISLLEEYCKDEFHLKVPSKFKLPPLVPNTEKTSITKTTREPDATNQICSDMAVPVKTTVKRNPTLTINPLKAATISSLLKPGLVIKGRNN